jgi:predicted glutamine amidotransferase
MCRWLVYVGTGAPLAPALLLYHEDHALIAQSENSDVYTPGLKRDSKHALRNHSVNVHGSGLGWYPEYCGPASGKRLPARGRLQTSLEVSSST